ncbi:MAG: hypothetical protein IJU14_04535 [Clostridia bacterium]|nr:hypothetical protein [Clostridia bacterium]
MNKKRVNDGIEPAKEAMTLFHIAKDGKITKTFRGQVSTFGAAVTMGSLKSAVAFFADKGASTVERTELLKAMYYVIQKGENNEYQFNESNFEPTNIFEYICRNDNNQTKEKFTDASLSVKLAMSFFDLVSE